MKAGVLLSGNGVYDGVEIREAVLVLLALSQNNVDVVCTAPDIDQHHVIDHTSGNEQNETRNVLKEAARIARGDIKPLSEAKVNDFDALVIPGGFGAAKNLSKWAFDGPKAEIHADVKKIILDFLKAQKPMLVLCIAPVLIALALKDENIKAKITLGTTEEKSPYNIQEINDAVNSLGAEHVFCSVKSFVKDEQNKIITSPCYMQDAPLKDIWQGIESSVKELVGLIKK